MLTVEFYERKKKFPKSGTEWRWRAIASNGKIVADSAEGYSEERWARNGFNVLKNGLASSEGYDVRTVKADGTIFPN